MAKLFKKTNFKDNGHSYLFFHKTPFEKMSCCSARFVLSWTLEFFFFLVFFACQYSKRAKLTWVQISGNAYLGTKFEKIEKTISVSCTWAVHLFKPGVDPQELEVGRLSVPYLPVVIKTTVQVFSISSRQIKKRTKKTKNFFENFGS